MIYLCTIWVFSVGFGTCMAEANTQTLRGASDDVSEDSHVLVAGSNAQTLSDYDRCSSNLLNPDLTPLNSYIFYLRCIGDVFTGREVTLPSDVPLDDSRTLPAFDDSTPPSNEELITKSAPATTKELVNEASPSKQPEVAETHLQSEPVRVPPVIKDAPRASSEIFLWLEWPGTVQGALFYDKVVSFVRSNSANYKVTKIVARVNNPNSEHKLWQVGTDSAFFVNFLSRLPSNVEVRVLPYLLDARSGDAWKSATGAPTSLEAVYRFVSDWNALLRETVGYSGPRISGIVADKEEQRGYLSEMPLIPKFQAQYSTPGHPLLKFGSTAGYDCAGSIPFLPKYIDEVYVEMYDFYVHGIHPAVVVESNAPSVANSPSNYLALLDDQVWYNMIPKYSTSTKIQFMWSLQHTGNDCLYPMGSFGCGAHNDLGHWSAESANDFLKMIASKYPVFGKQPKGFFQFSFLPPSWM